MEFIIITERTPVNAAYCRRCAAPIMEMSTRAIGRRRNLLLVDENVALCSRLAAALEQRGFNVEVCHNGEQACHLMQNAALEFVVTDLKLPDWSGLRLISRLKAVAPHASIVVLTGHASIATAVEAIKLGATHYLPKPAAAEQIISALERRGGDDSLPLENKGFSIRRQEWEYINWVLVQHGGNVSAAARALSMHRRTLQRKLYKNAIR